MQLQNKIILAAAGSGKTWGMCNDALHNAVPNKKILMVSFTNKGVESLNQEYSKQNYGVVDHHIKILTWYQFLLKELIRPYQSFFLNEINKVKSFDFSGMYGRRDYSRKNTKSYYLNSNEDVKANNASEFAVYLNELSNGLVIKRLEEIYSCIYIDELQDLTGRDINLLELLLLSSIGVYCVGDYKQATLKTHNPKANKKKSGQYIFDYLMKLEHSHNLNIVGSNESRRFIQDIAEFANLVYPNDPIIGKNETSEEFMGVYQIKLVNLEDYIDQFNPRILRFDKRTETYGYSALNFGVSKGMTFERVLIFPNGPLNIFLKDPNKGLKSPHKYYVGVTRPKYSLAFVVKDLNFNEYFMEETIDIQGKEICVAKFSKK